MGTSQSLDKAKEDFKTAWEAFKQKHSQEELSEAYRAMNIRGEG